MNTTSTANQPATVASTLRHASAFTPILMSLVVLSLVLLHIALYGTAREADEGTVAHLWQLLMGLQLPIIGFFAIRWLPQDRSSATAVLGLQFLAGVAAAAPVLYYHL
jgi:hypothetical protein